MHTIERGLDLLPWHSPFFPIDATDPDFAHSNLSISRPCRPRFIHCYGDGLGFGGLIVASSGNAGLQAVTA
jgi:hypothetical protein